MRLHVRSLLHEPLLRFAAILLVAAPMTQGCSMKRNTAASRNYTAFITRYNIYYNGDEHYRRTLDEMERAYEDDFSSMLPIHPADARATPDAPQPTGDFSRSADKARKAIQLRSIKRRPAPRRGRSSDPEHRQWMRRGEYNPFLHNAWMMLGRSLFADGDFSDAAAVFYYVSRHFQWLPETVTEARIWLARSYMDQGLLSEAEMTLWGVKERHLTSKELRYLHNLAMADLMVRTARYSQALQPLADAAAQARGVQKGRLTFLLGQVNEVLGRKADAAAAFSSVGNMSGLSHRMRVNARIKRSDVCTDMADASRQLESMQRLTRYAANKPYLTQIHHAIARLKLQLTDTAGAISSFRKAIGSSENGIYRAMAQADLGNLLYDMHSYTDAQPLLAEAVPALHPGTPNLTMTRRRSDTADELAIHAGNVQLQDSLLRLAALPPEQQLEIARHLAADHRRKLREAESAVTQQTVLPPSSGISVIPIDGAAAQPMTFTLNTDRSWYFYNTAAREAGKAEFQRRWGGRPLEDDWRRSDKSSAVFLSDINGSEQPTIPDSRPEEKTDKPVETHNDRSSDPSDPEYYLSRIPSDPTAISLSLMSVRKGLFNLALTLKDRIGDYPNASKVFDTLLERFPDTPDRAEVIYNQFLMAVLQDNPQKSERYRRMFIAENPDTEKARAMSSPGYIARMHTAATVCDSLYNHAYMAYMADDNPALRRIVAKVRADYPATPLMPKFMFLEALSHLSENNPGKSSVIFRELALNYPESDVTPLASAYAGITPNDSLPDRSGNIRGFIWDSSMLFSPSDQPDLTATGTPGDRSVSDYGPQVLLLVFDPAATNANQLLFEVARFNFETCTDWNLDIGKISAGTLGIITVEGFADADEATRYRSHLESDGTSILAGLGAIPVAVSASSFSDMLAGRNSLRGYLQATAARRLEEIRQTVLPSGQYPSETEARHLDTGDRGIESPEAETGKPETFDIPVPPPPPGKPNPTHRLLRPQKRQMPLQPTKLQRK